MIFTASSTFFEQCISDILGLLSGAILENRSRFPKNNCSVALPSSFLANKPLLHTFGEGLHGSGSCAKFLIFNFPSNANGYEVGRHRFIWTHIHPRIHQVLSVSHLGICSQVRSNSGVSWSLTQGIQTYSLESTGTCGALSGECAARSTP